MKEKMLGTIDKHGANAVLVFTAVVSIAALIFFCGYFGIEMIKIILAL